MSLPTLYILTFTIKSIFAFFKLLTNFTLLAHFHWTGFVRLWRNSHTLKPQRKNCVRPRMSCVVNFTLPDWLLFKDMLTNVCQTLKAYLHGQWFSVSDATATSKDRNNPIFCAVSDVTAASDTENPRSCKQTISLPNIELTYSWRFEYLQTIVSLCPVLNTGDLLLNAEPLARPKNVSVRLTKKPY
jgi:hypothetical protein